jgi:hypothetical protein
VVNDQSDTAQILVELQRLSELAPEFRFGQMIANLAFLAEGPWNETLWDLEDDKLLAALREQVAQFQGRQVETRASLS